MFESIEGSKIWVVTQLPLTFAGLFYIPNLINYYDLEKYKNRMVVSVLLITPCYGLSQAGWALYRYSSCQKNRYYLSINIFRGFDLCYFSRNYSVLWISSR